MKPKDSRIVQWYSKVADVIMDGDKTAGAVVILSMATLVVTLIYLVLVLIYGDFMWKALAILGLAYSIASMFGFISRSHNYRRKETSLWNMFLILVPSAVQGFFIILVAIFTWQLEFNAKPSK